jgi:hypothetical protein
MCLITMSMERLSVRYRGTCAAKPGHFTRSGHFGLMSRQRGESCSVMEGADISFAKMFPAREDSPCIGTRGARKRRRHDALGCTRDLERGPRALASV